MGWEEKIFDILFRALESGKLVGAIRPGMEAEEIMRGFYGPYLEEMRKIKSSGYI